MSLARIASYVFLGSLFGILALWGYWPSAWAAGWPAMVLLGLSAVGLVLWIVFSIEGLALWMKKRSTQFSIGLALKAIAGIAILGAINWFVTVNNKKYDVTVNKVHSLSDQSRRISSELQQKITIRVWAQNIQEMSPNIDLRKFLENYEIASKGKIKIEVKNPVEDPVETRKDAIKRDKVIIVRSESGAESRIENFAENTAEEQVTNALIQLIKGGKKTVCFLAGHGEASINDAQPAGLSTVRDALSESSYTAKEFNLVEAKEVPSDCRAVVVVGPQGDPTEQEVGILKQYLEGGGKMLALFGSGTPGRWRNFAEGFGVSVNEDYLIDLQSEPMTMVVTKNFANDVAIAKGLGQFVVFRDASSLKIPNATKGPDGSEIKTFVSSRDKVLALTGDIRKIKAIRPKPSDFKGALPLAVLVTKTVGAAPKSNDPVVPPPSETKPLKPETPAPPTSPQSESGWLDRLVPTAHAQDDGHDHGSEDIEMGEAALPPPAPSPKAPEAKGDSVGKIVEDKKTDDKMALIVVGNHLFPVNGFIEQYGNLDFFLNSVNYLMKDQDLIGIRPRDLKQASLELNPVRMRQVVATIFILSGLFLVGAIASHRRRSSV